jgi:hypothetical protein
MMASALLTSIVLLASFTNSEGFRSIGTGGTGGLEARSLEVIRTQAQYRSLWKRLSSTLTLADRSRRTPEEAPNNVDWSSEQVVVVHGGQQPTGGYSVRILEVDESGNQVEVRAKLQSPGPNARVTQALTQPYAVISLPKTQKKLRLVMD